MTKSSASPVRARFRHMGPFLVNVDHVRKIEPTPSGLRVHWSNGDEDVVPRDWVEDFLNGTDDA